MYNKTLCGSTLPEPVESTSNSLTLWFYTDGSVSHRGFKARYNSELPARKFVLNSNSGVLISKYGPIWKSDSSLWRRINRLSGRCLLSRGKNRNAKHDDVYFMRMDTFKLFRKFDNCDHHKRHEIASVVHYQEHLLHSRSSSCAARYDVQFANVT